MAARRPSREEGERRGGLAAGYSWCPGGGATPRALVVFVSSSGCGRRGAWKLWRPLRPSRAGVADRWTPRDSRETYPMQSVYLCNHAIREYEASDLNPTIAAILHLNPPTSSVLLLFATRRGLLGFLLAGIAFPAPNPEQVEKLRNAATWCGARAPARHPNHRPASEDGAEEGELRPHGSPWPRRTLPASLPWESEGGQTGAAVHARLRRRSPRGGAADGAGRSSSPAAPPPPQRHAAPPTAAEGRAATGGHGRRRADGSGGQVHRAAPPRPPCRAAMATGGRGGARRPPDGEGGGGRLASPWPPRRRSSPPAAGRACRARRQLQGAAPVRARRHAPAPQPARERRRGPRRHSVCACVAAVAPAHARRWLAAAVRRPPRSLARTSRRAPAVARARGKGEGGARLAGSQAWLLGPATGRGRRGREEGGGGGRPHWRVKEAEEEQIRPLPPSSRRPARGHRCEKSSAPGGGAGCGRRAGPWRPAWLAGARGPRRRAWPAGLRGTPGGLRGCVKHAAAGGGARQCAGPAWRQATAAGRGARGRAVRGPAWWQDAVGGGAREEIGRERKEKEGGRERKLGFGWIQRL
ncbi:hypothetical protein PVAP13_1NG113744 [Panicum virgatum]|uniref:Uncharacterized protein n=1 Tax=Panicum virgatum TaxID=38727 RepID=A0A8T0WSR0_PANVG|nr:hypothetical protein PVAP13_1NG113744 [Panicum virgatum]